MHKELKPLRTHYCTVSSRTRCVHPIFEYKRGRARGNKAATVEGARETRARARNLGRADPDVAPQRATQGGWGATASYEDSGWRTIKCAAARRVPAELSRKEVVPEANEHRARSPSASEWRASSSPVVAACVQTGTYEDSAYGQITERGRPCAERPHRRRRATPSRRDRKSACSSRPSSWRARVGRRRARTLRQKDAPVWK